MNVVWSPLALQKLGDAADFISLDNPAAAEKWVHAVFDQAELLGSMPEMGRFVPEMPHTHYREIIFGHYRLICSLSHEIRLLTVRHCRQILAADDV